MGRAAIFLVIGFSAIFLMTGKNMSSVGVESLKNSVDYYETSQRFSIALAGANMACTQFYKDSSWSAGYDTVNYNGGSFHVTVQHLPQNHIQITSTGTYD